ncbi:UvrD-helicase domain-containing protein [Pelolinea submarina]|uniref:Superfamily I DNA/RNA helicase n=1 Tax=Pelolinea submarina TaxID=913107 RepID=A0A347ZRJ8_9CHLR|nr:UvrD-helicase domain-containing protein [Pelolinea submarina]REG11515.1 superfamily I DNA/RNA helicase [Pelolinea submarina]BBB47929.1 DNA helicase II /ATP-dependent DNA helicase PcrA [Pelolinea submarina]
MTENNPFENQAEQRKEYLDKILQSDNPRKLIVAGPGTGKTYTFGAIFNKKVGKRNLALSFIRKLVEDMENDLGNRAEVRTFHAFCKKLLHKRNGRIELIPFLTKIVESDANFLGNKLSDFDEKFQMLDEDSPELTFYLERGDYYNAVSFNDTVYRLYKHVRDGHLELPTYDQIVVDEYQDFNPLEVALIEELEKKSPILIVGDDDQAVYSGRNSSPAHLRAKYESGEYQVFQLPFCSRCPRVVVEATTAFIKNVTDNGGLQDRIERPFFPYLEDKDYENSTYPKIVKATTSTISCLSKFIAGEIKKIPEIEIKDAHEKNYPCVLLVGKRQYLNPLAKKLGEFYANINFSEAQDYNYSICDAYDMLLHDDDSNLGWRILAEFEFNKVQIQDFIKSSLDGTPFNKILPEEFICKHLKVVNIIRAGKPSEQDRQALIGLIGEKSDQILGHFYGEQKEKQETDLSQPTILLSSFEGCKGLSAGHVFIVGLNEGIVPKIDSNGNVDNIEYCKFVVALTRTLKRCYLLSNKWDYNPNDREPYLPSQFTQIIPGEFIEDRGYLTSKDITQ